MKREQQLKQAYLERFDARISGKEATDNPYRQLTQRWFEWADGWKDQDHHLNQRAAFLGR